MNKVMLVGRLTRDPELRSLPSGKHVATWEVAEYTNEHEHPNLVPPCCLPSAKLCRSALTRRYQPRRPEGQRGEFSGR